MSQLRLDPLTGRWVVVSLERGARPFACRPRSLPVQDDPDRPCPFCPDGADPRPPSLEVLGPDGRWQVRIVPNRYPALEGATAMAVTNLGPVYTQAPASGIHEVVVFDPGHRTTFADLGDDRSSAFMHALAARIAQHAAVPGLRYSQVIVNAGREAGASVDHPHGQLLGVPFAPREITAEQAGFARFSGNCLLCATIEAEDAADHRTVFSDDEVQVVCPFWSGTPFEMLITPRRHAPRLHEASRESLAGVGRGLQQALGALRSSLGDVPYNVAFHGSPFHSGPDFHWHAHLLPKLATPGGFELGTGVLVNVVSPERAAGDLRSALLAA